MDHGQRGDQPGEARASAGGAMAVDPVERARSLVPVIEAHADRIERDRRLPAPLLEALHEGGMFALTLPRRLGGGEVDPITYLRTLETIAGADASVAWCLCQAGGCAASASAYLSPAVARAMYGAGRRGVLAWGPGPKARAVAVEGGYRVSGTWNFASGGHHATWLGGDAPIYERDGTPRLDAAGAPVARTMIFPASAAQIADAWEVVGLRGTGSDSFAVNDLFVPAEWSLSRDYLVERRDPAPLYNFPPASLYSAGFASVALGIARRLLDDFVALARDKVPIWKQHTLRDSCVVQMQVAQAEAQYAAARLFLHDALAEPWRQAAPGGSLSVAERIRIRLAASHAIHQAVQIADMAYHAAGATAIFAGGPYERRFRDIHALAQQLQARLSHFETVGRFLLGLEPSGLVAI